MSKTERGKAWEMKGGEPTARPHLPRSGKTVGIISHAGGYEEECHLLEADGKYRQPRLKRQLFFGWLVFWLVASMGYLLYFYLFTN